MMELDIALLPGDGVGPEVTNAALRVVEAAIRGSGVGLSTRRFSVGWSAVVESGEPLPGETLSGCLDADAVFLGAVGHPDADGEPLERRPETGLLRLRAELGCWANLRPARVFDALVSRSGLRPELARGTDLLIVRELGSGIYYGEPRGEADGVAFNTMRYGEDEIRGIARMAMELSRERKGRVTSVDKANVLEVSRLWRRIVDEVAGDFEGEVAVEHMLVDRAAMELTLDPSRFDVVLTANLFGDILSDQAAGVVGSLGALGSASLGGAVDLYEPVHGSAPELAGRGEANPLGAIESFCIMLRVTFGLHEPADRIQRGVERSLADGVRTGDLAGDGEAAVSCDEFADAVIQRMTLAGVGASAPSHGTSAP